MAHPPNQKHLFELLQDDQEPFLLQDYIADRRCQIIRTRVQAKHQYCYSSASLQQPPGAVKKRRPISRNLARSACFLSFSADSPVSGDPRKSPLCFPKSPVIGSPAAAAVRRSKTASLLLEAALRISQKKQQQQQRSSAKARNGGIFGSLLRRITQGRRKGGKIDGGESGKVSVKDVLRWDFQDSPSAKSSKSKSSSPSLRNGRTGRGGCETTAPGSTGPNSAVWSESTNADLDLDGCSSAGRSSCCLSDEEEMEFVNEIMEFASSDNKQFCESPFRFVLQTSPSSSGCRTPDFSSPAASPIRLKAEGNENNSDGESLKKLKQQAGNEEEAEEEKEQCSPVSVLDPLFADDDEDDYCDDDQTQDDGFDMECSFAFVQRAKHQLLQKLRRFERLAELDPIELEKLMLEHDDEEEEEETEEIEEGEDEKSQFVIDELSRSSFQCIPRDMKRLVSDLIDEEERGSIRNNNVSGASEDAAARRVCKRFESWKDVESNTIEMMVEQDFVRSEGEWRGNRDEVSDAAIEIEVAIFGLLAEELAEELLLLTQGGGPLMV
ncbi:unnamed protein product [Linum trigynum]|uniref:DUF4378 domain-containing protein n=2 Tax=Linum trigynum TaxID=586398 RepID=A0AAV2FK02_9ROSI